MLMPSSDISLPFNLYDTMDLLVIYLLFRQVFGNILWFPVNPGPQISTPE